MTKGVAAAPAVNVTTGTTASVPPPPASAAVPDGIGHSPYRRAADLLQRLAPGKMRIGFLLGAGCPLAIRVPSGDATRPLIPEIAGLTTAIKATLESNGTLGKVAQDAWARVVAKGISKPTIEEILGHVRTLKSLCGTGTDPVDGFAGKDLDLLDAAICNEIRSIVTQTLPTMDTPYHHLASWIQTIPREKPVEIFTTNYDLLLEQALEDQRAPYFDGFVGSDSAFLDLESMAEDDLPARWTRLWKIHGSVNWWMTAKRKIRRSREVHKGEGEQLLIYPSHLKYDQSRQMPYYAMLDRLRIFLRSDQCVLLTCGYSFSDPHIDAYIEQGLSGNPNAACFAMLFGDRAARPLVVEMAQRHSNMTLLAADGAVIGTKSRSWHAPKKEDHPAYQIAVGTEMAAGRTSAPPEQSKWLLGDFAALGAFLAHQLSSRDIEQGVIDAS